MTNKEAIKLLNLIQAEMEWDYPMDYAVAIDMAISALEKQIPKKPKMPLDAYWVCPTCGNKVEYPYECCKRCGQAIDWRNE